MALNEYAEVYCITTKDFEPPNEHFKNIKFYPILPNRFIKYIDIRLLWWIKKNKPQRFDCVIIEQPFLGILATLSKLFFRLPFVIHGHNVETQRFESMKKWWVFLIRIYEKWTMQKAKHIFLISKEDKKWVQEHWKISNSRLSILPYFASNTMKQFISENRKWELRQKLQIQEGQKSLFFFGSLAYPPNAEALQIIIYPLLGLLRQTLQVPFKIYIAGNGLDNKTKKSIVQEPELIHIGFVSDIAAYLQVMDICLNPVLSGGGVKTKVIEALTLNVPVVSTQAGAMGVAYADGQMKVCKYRDWNAFAAAIASILERKQRVTPNAFQEYYSLENAVKVVKSII